MTTDDGWTVVENSGPAFVAWPDGDDYARAEGVFAEIRTGQHGKYMVLDPGTDHENLSIGRGKDDNRVVEPVEAGTPVSIGLKYATLEDKVKEEHLGCLVRIESLGWEQPKGGGNRYRRLRYSYKPIDPEYPG
jgi:hypothetical protein